MHTFVGCNTITFERLDIGSSFSHIRYTLENTGQVRIFGSRSRSQEQKGKKCIFPQFETLIGHNSASIKQRHEVQSVSCDRKRPHITKCTHLWVVCLRLEGILVDNAFQMSTLCRLSFLVTPYMLQRTDISDTLSFCLCS